MHTAWSAMAKIDHPQYVHCSNWDFKAEAENMLQ